MREIISNKNNLSNEEIENLLNLPFEDKIKDENREIYKKHQSEITLYANKKEIDKNFNKNYYKGLRKWSETLNSRYMEDLTQPFIFYKGQKEVHLKTMNYANEKIASLGQEVIEF